jgi:hypothetical protein
MGIPFKANQGHRIITNEKCKTNNNRATGILPDRAGYSRWLFTTGINKPNFYNIDRYPDPSNYFQIQNIRNGNRRTICPDQSVYAGGINI